MKNTETAIFEALEEMDNFELMEIHNQYCENCNYMDDQIFVNDEEFFEVYFDGRITELIRAIHYGNFNPNEEFIKFDGYANLETFENVAYEIDLEAIAENIFETQAKEYYSIELEDEE